MFINCGEEFNRKHLARYKEIGLESVIREYVTIEQILGLDDIDDFIYIDELLCLENLALIHIAETTKRNVLELGVWSVDLSNQVDCLERFGLSDFAVVGDAVLPFGESAPT